MKIIKYILLALSLVTATNILKANDLTIQADSAYNSLAYARALELYKQALDSIGTSSDLYYNIGNTYYRMNDLGRAIIWYERALQLDPTNKDARTNLAFVNTRITDKPIDDRSLLSRGYDSLVNAMHPDSWAWVTFALFSLTIIAFICYLITKGVVVRKVSFFGGGILLILTICAIAVSVSAASNATNHDNAVITSPAAQLSTAPRTPSDTNSQAFLLHEGTKVEIVDSVMNGNADSWYEVKVGGNARAWINSKDIERI